MIYGYIRVSTDKQPKIKRLKSTTLQRKIKFRCTNSIQVWTIKDGYKLGTDIQSKVLAFAFGLSAEIERNLISQRTCESLTRLKSEGKRLGRPIGHSPKSIEKWQNHQERIHTLLKVGIPKRQISISLGVSETPLYRFIQRQM